jgi:hypothetical protein
LGNKALTCEVIRFARVSSYLKAILEKEMAMKEKKSVFTSARTWNQRIHYELGVHKMTRRGIAVLVLLLGVLAIGFA